MKPLQKIIDAEFEVVRGPPKIGEAHPSRPGWYFTGNFDAEGHPLFKAWWLRAFDNVFAASTLTIAVLAAIPLIALILLVLIGGPLLWMGVLKDPRPNSPATIPYEAVQAP
ncbi:MAG: hypothetical protein U1A07_19135 [Phenylobacterium sp.]|nr:hypothetical protein [Phenylobacterium sp.]MDZ4320923.1 hypothetical protein [Phenylobacterium sp.]